MIATITSDLLTKFRVQWCINMHQHEVLHANGLRLILVISCPIFWCPSFTSFAEEMLSNSRVLANTWMTTDTVKLVKAFQLFRSIWSIILVCPHCPNGRATQDTQFVDISVATKAQFLLDLKATSFARVTLCSKSIARPPDSHWSAFVCCIDEILHSSGKDGIFVSASFTTFCLKRP